MKKRESRQGKSGYLILETLQIKQSLGKSVCMFTLCLLLKGQSLARTLGGLRLESDDAGLIPWV